MPTHQSGNQTWVTGDTITAPKFENIENKIDNLQATKLDGTGGIISGGLTVNGGFIVGGGLTMTSGDMVNRDGSSLITRWLNERGIGVATGVNVTFVSGMIVRVNTGRGYLSDGTHRAFTATQDFTIAPGHATLNRIDVVYYDGTGTLAVVQGVPATTATEPAIPTGAVKLARITINKTVTTLTAAMIADQRQFIVGPANGKLVVPVGVDKWAT